MLSKIVLGEINLFKIDLFFFKYIFGKVPLIRINNVHWTNKMAPLIESFTYTGFHLSGVPLIVHRLYTLYTSITFFLR